MAGRLGNVGERAGTIKAGYLEVLQRKLERARLKNEDFPILIS
jgi:hypothetical protein